MKKTTKILSVILAALMLASLCMVHVFAADVTTQSTGDVETGTTGGCKWTYFSADDEDVGTLQILADDSGVMDDYSQPADVPWSKYYNKIEKVYLGDITHIGNYSLSWLHIKEIYIPNTVESIGEFAFLYCQKLESVFFEYGTTPLEIGTGAFITGMEENDSKLKEIVIPSRTNKIGARACGSYYSMTESSYGGVSDFTLVTASEAIANWATHYDNITVNSYDGTSGECAWTLKESTGEMEVDGYGYGRMNDYYFEDEPEWSDKNITSISFNDDVTTIGEYAFNNLSTLTKISLSASVKKINKESFRGCKKLETITVDSANPTLYMKDGILYSKTEPETQTKNYTTLVIYPTNKSSASFTIPSGVKEVYDYAFLDCAKLKSVTFPDSVKKINFSAFSNCTKLSTVKFGSGLTTIDPVSFYNTALKSVYIPKNVTSINYQAFGFVTNDHGLPSADPNTKLYCVKGTSAEKACKTYKNNSGIAYTCLNLGSSSLNAGATKNLTPAAGTVKSWTSNKKSVAAVKSGKVTALKKGSATITATLSDGAKITGKVTVKTNPKLSKSSVTVTKGKTVKVNIIGKAAAIKNVYTNTNIAKITSKNTATTLVVKGLKTGSTTLKVKVNGVTLKLNVKVK